MYSAQQAIEILETSTIHEVINPMFLARQGAQQFEMPLVNNFSYRSTGTNAKSITINPNTNIKDSYYETAVTLNPNYADTKDVYYEAAVTLNPGYVDSNVQTIRKENCIGDKPALYQPAALDNPPFAIRQTICLSEDKYVSSTS